jgi:hypothetical protein
VDNFPSQENYLKAEPQMSQMTRIRPFLGLLICAICVICGEILEPGSEVRGDGKEEFSAFSAISAVNYYYNSMTKELEWFIGILQRIWLSLREVQACGVFRCPERRKERPLLPRMTG